MNDGKIKIALEGPINKCTDNECIDWRNYVINELGNEQFEYHNPMNFDCRGKEKELEKELIEYDTNGLKTSDIILVMGNKAGWGTAMAVQMAWASDKTIITICSEPNPSPWLKNRSTKIVKTLEEGIELIKNWKVNNEKAS